MRKRVPKVSWQLLKPSDIDENYSTFYNIYIYICVYIYSGKRIGPKLVDKLLNWEINNIIDQIFRNLDDDKK